MFLGYKKRSYSGFLGYNYYAKYIVFLHGFGALWKSNHTLLISEYTSMTYEKKTFFSDGIPLSFQFATEFCKYIDVIYI